MADELNSTPSAQAAPTVPTWWVYAVAAALVLCFADYLGWMLERWWKDEYYGHGFMIPVISGYLVWRQWPKLRSLPREGFERGLWVMGGGVLLHVVATFTDVNFASGFAFIIALYGAIIWLFGWPVARTVAFPVAYLVFMVPLGRVLVDMFAQPMQLFSAKYGAAVAIAIGIPAETEGTTIHIPNYTFEVAIACSGLKSVISMSALGTLYAYMVDAALWKRVALVIASFPVAIAANGGRITTTLVLGRIFGQKAAEGFFHSFSGTLVFLLAFMGLFLVGAILRCTRMRDDI
jgi:exosortase A